MKHVGAALFREAAPYVFGLKKYRHYEQLQILLGVSGGKDFRFL